MKRRFPTLPLAVVAALAALWLAPNAFLWVGETYSRVTSSEINQRIYETEVRPAADWVREFYQQHQRLPTPMQFSAYAKAKFPSNSITLFDSRPAWQRTWGTQGVDFMICVRADEWNLYHQSWDKREWKAWTD